MCCRQNDDGLTIATALDEMHKIESHIDQKNSSDFPVGFHSICDKKKRKKMVTKRVRRTDQKTKVRNEHCWKSRKKKEKKDNWMERKTRKGRRNKFSSGFDNFFPIFQFHFQNLFFFHRGHLLSEILSVQFVCHAR